MALGSLDGPFAPEGTIKLTANVGSLREPLPLVRGKTSRSVRILVDESDLSGKVYLRLGDEDVQATTADMPFFFGSDQTIGNPDLHPYVAVLSPAGPVEVSVTVGRGV